MWLFPTAFSLVYDIEIAVFYHRVRQNLDIKNLIANEQTAIIPDQFFFIRLRRGYLQTPVCWSLTAKALAEEYYSKLILSPGRPLNSKFIIRSSNFTCDWLKRLKVNKGWRHKIPTYYGTCVSHKQWELGAEKLSTAFQVDLASSLLEKKASYIERTLTF